MQAGLLSRERYTSHGAEGMGLPEGNTVSPDMARESGPGAVGDPMHAWTLLAREPGDPVSALGGDGLWGRGGKSEDAIHR